MRIVSKSGVACSSVALLAVVALWIISTRRPMEVVATRGKTAVFHAYAGGGRIQFGWLSVMPGPDRWQAGFADSPRYLGRMPYT